jgi:hypothetical protein
MCQVGRKLRVVGRKWAPVFFLLQVGSKRVKRDSCILQRKRVLEWLQEGSHRWKTGQAGPAQVLQEGSRQVKPKSKSKEVTWSIGSPPAGWTTLSTGIAARGQLQVEDGSSGTGTGVARGQQTGQRGGLVHGESASGVDNPTSICSCKRPYLGVRRAKRGPHSCCKWLAEEAYGA